MAVTLALVSHVVLYQLLSRTADRREPLTAATDETRHLVFVMVPPRPDRRDSVQEAKAGGTRTPTRKPTDVPVAASGVVNAQHDGTVAAGTAPQIDWNRESESVARAAAAGRGAAETRSFSPEPKTLRTHCAGPKSSFKFDPEPARAGFSGGLPYVRLGKRCVVGLGFFGCALGELPKADGSLLDHLDDASDSSVPATDECEGPEK